MADHGKTGGASIWLSLGRLSWEFVKVIVMAVVIIVPVRYFLVQPFFVRGASMEPNFINGEYLVIDELSYRWREPRRGEVVVFRFPNDTSQFYIKRIVGLPGDTVQVRDGQVVIRNQALAQGAVLDETTYLPGLIRTGGNSTLHLAANEYFVLGDNRAASSDSRSWGALPKHDLIGRAWLRAFPVTRLAWFEPQPVGFMSL